MIFILELFVIVRTPKKDGDPLVVGQTPDHDKAKDIAAMHNDNQTFAKKSDGSIVGNNSFIDIVTKSELSAITPNLDNQDRKMSNKERLIDICKQVASMPEFVERNEFCGFYTPADIKLVSEKRKNDKKRLADEDCFWLVKVTIDGISIFAGFRSKLPHQEWKDVEEAICADIIDRIFATAFTSAHKEVKEQIMVMKNRRSSSHSID